VGLIDDILKGLPANPVLREKITQLEAEKAATDQENAFIKDDNRALQKENTALKAENAKLKQKIEELTHPDDLNEIELKLLQCIAALEYDHNVLSIIHHQSCPELSAERVRYHLKRLEDLKLLHGGIADYMGTHYRLTQNGRKLLLDKDLL